ncbi:hypothetical protein [Chondrinema litorale]|uniref:hypothetical protein n=1 Tax=Chondrinema litorale TaxID=2994555 RepID=UPI0025427D44|nr:hypothetical protein [Chondrinema litorale]UZR98303.1 hypothetical protein OQ292_31200 [Chondrinema litorale]
MRNVIVVVLLVYSTGLLAQTKLPIKFSLFNESTSIPFTGLINTPIHPGIQVGTEFEWKETNKIRLYPSVNVGYMFHNKLFQGIYANLELGFDYKFDFGLNIKSSFGVGYLHTFTTQQEYRFENGAYVAKADRGNARIMPSFSLGMGYRLKPSDSKSTEIFVMYQSWLEFPYSPGFISLMSHNSFHIGSKFYPFK